MGAQPRARSKLLGCAWRIGTDWGDFTWARERCCKGVRRGDPPNSERPPNPLLPGFCSETERNFARRGNGTCSRSFPELQAGRLRRWWVGLGWRKKKKQVSWKVRMRMIVRKTRVVVFLGGGIFWFGEDPPPSGATSLALFFSLVPRPTALGEKKSPPPGARRLKDCFVELLASLISVLTCGGRMMRSCELTVEERISSSEELLHGSLNKSLQDIFFLRRRKALVRGKRLYGLLPNILLLLLVWFPCKNISIHYYSSPDRVCL